VIRDRGGKSKEKKQAILSTWMISGTEDERSKLTGVQERNSRRKDVELEIEEKVVEKKNPIPKISCVKGVSRKELSWKERAVRRRKLQNSGMTYLKIAKFWNEVIQNDPII